MFGKTKQADGKGNIFTVTKAMKKSEARLIPLTPAPKTAWQKIKRNAVG
jgi:hypothetical protein